MRQETERQPAVVGAARATHFSNLLNTNIEITISLPSFPGGGCLLGQISFPTGRTRTREMRSTVNSRFNFAKQTV